MSKGVVLSRIKMSGHDEAVIPMEVKRLSKVKEEGEAECASNNSRVHIRLGCRLTAQREQVASKKQSSA